MSRIRFKFIVCVFVFLFTLLFREPAFAHGGEPRLEISLERINPGGIMEVRGVDFEYETEIALKLVGNQVDIPLGSVMSDVEGIFVQSLTLPSDLKEGVYVLRATTYDHVVYSPTFTVWGVAIINEEENVILDQSDVQLEPMPTVVPGAPTLTLADAPTAAGPTSERNYGIVALAGLVVIGTIIAFGVMRKRKS